MKFLLYMRKYCLRIILLQLLLAMTMPVVFIQTWENPDQADRAFHEHVKLDSKADSLPKKIKKYHVNPQEEKEPNLGTTKHSIQANQKHLLNMFENYEEKPIELASYSSIPSLPNLKGVSCQAIFNNNSVEIKHAQKVQKDIKYNELHSADILLEKLDNCTQFISHRHYLSGAVSFEERDFPIAFSILLYKDPIQVEKLLRAIYRPQNYYCLHVDRNSPFYVHQVMQKLAKCFSNVFVASKTISVEWGWYSVVAPDVACMQDLIQYRKWKYFINLTGQEFPLKTNLELVRILKAYNGANDVQAAQLTHSSGSIQDRFKWGYKMKKGKLIKYEKTPFQHNITWAKGAVHIAASRGYVDFVVNSQVGKDLLSWAEDTFHASEHVFNPLQMSPQLGVPGAYTGNSSTTYSGSRVRFKNWITNKNMKCHGKYSRDICIIGVGDLPFLKRSPSMFVNKLHADFHPIAYHCLEQYIFNKTRQDFLGKTVLNTKVYSNLDFVQNHLPDEKSWLRLPEFAVR